MIGNPSSICQDIVQNMQWKYVTTLRDGICKIEYFHLSMREFIYGDIHDHLLSIGFIDFHP